MGISILATNGFHSTMISWFLLVPARVPALVSIFSLLSFLKLRALFQQDFLVPGRVPVLVSLLFCSFVFQDTGLFHHGFLVPARVPALVLFFSVFSQDRGSVPSWFPGSSYFPLRFRRLSPFFSLVSFFRQGVMFHHDFLIFRGFRCLPPFSFFCSRIDVWGFGF